MSELRKLMTDEIADGDWLDYAFKRGDNNAISFKTYQEYLASLDAYDFLATYNRVRDAEQNLD